MKHEHRWNKKESTEEQWENFKGLSAVLLDLPEVRCTIARSSDDPDQPPCLDSTMLLFNGVGLHGKQPLFISRKADRDFCDTGKQPYDTIVVAALTLLKFTHGDDCDIRSDSDPTELEEGLKLAAKVVREFQRMEHLNGIPKNMEGVLDGW